MTLGEIADLLDHHKIKRVPVVRDGRLVGIVSRSDLVRAFLAADRKQPSTALPPDDRRIRAELQRRLQGQSWSHSSYLQSVVHDGVVEFFGVTRSEDEKRALEVLAETIPGVTRVEDRTTIESYLVPM
jgi:CBS domain-containing protein